MRKHQIFYKHTRALYGVIQVVAGVIKKKKYDDLKRFTSFTLPYKIIAVAKKHSKYFTVQSITPCIYSECSRADNTT